MLRLSKVVAMILLAGGLAAGLTQTAGDSHPRSHIAHPHPMRSNAEIQITALIKQFLANVNDPAMHSRFWADDLIYVSSTGAVRSKQEIVNSVRAEAGRGVGMAPAERYESEDIVVRLFGSGSIAVVNFTLVAHEPRRNGSSEKIRRYRNSGVFQLNNDGWQAVGWQSTAIAAAPKK